MQPSMSLNINNMFHPLLRSSQLNQGEEILQLHLFFLRASPRDLCWEGHSRDPDSTNC